MSAIVILAVALVLLLLGYLTYGAWLAKKWGVDPDRKTPAVEINDGKDYVPAKPAVLMGHHFSSIAGAGPINGPIQAAVFGWVPVFLWIVIGGIFFGAMHDFGSLFASIRHGGHSIAEVIKVNIGKKAHTLFLIFGLLVLLLVIASFTAVVSGTFASEAPTLFTTGADVSNTAATATISLAFIVLAILFGLLTYKAGMKVGWATIIGIIGIVGITIFGLNVGINLPKGDWIIFIAAYIAVASLVPVWILLQPRDYLSSFLLYAMMLAAIVGVFGTNPTVELPAYTGFVTKSGAYLFPTLFITVACGAISGFHSLVGSGTTSKQLASEKDAKIIGYGGMIIECALAIVALISVGVIWTMLKEGGNAAEDALSVSAPAKVFATGIATMLKNLLGDGAYRTSYALVTLSVSVFALTSLDTGTRLGRYMFQELFIGDKKDSFAAKVFGNPYFGTLFMVGIGCTLGALGLSQLWQLFGAANQLLAGLALMAVAAWLGNIGKSNKMFIFPMIFMLCATLTSLIMTAYKKFMLIFMTADAAVVWGDYFQLIFALALAILAIILTIEGIRTLSTKKPAEKAKA